MRVVLDTNILVRAAYRLEGPAAEVLDRVSHPPHLLILSPAILDEFGRVFQYPRFREVHGLSDEAMARFIDNLGQEALMLDVTVGPAEILDDPGRCSRPRFGTRRPSRRDLHARQALPSGKSARLLP